MPTFLLTLPERNFGHKKFYSSLATIFYQHKETIMKKMMIILLALCFLAPVGVFAVTLEGIAGVKLSNQVEGTYFTDSTTNPLAYQLSTGHAQGNKVYATGSADARIYTNEIAGASFVSSDLLTSYSADQISSGDTWSAL